MSSAIEQLIDDLVQAFNRRDAVAADNAYAQLVSHDADSVTETLGLRVLEAWDRRNGRPLDPAPYLPDPSVGQRLIDALDSEDVDRVLNEVDMNYPKLLITMLCTLSAMSQ